ncbi:MAG: hypothetical protein PHZ19_06225 [Candidatus Thermoplasmatota archaeon]|nr:hypothetical protein [Candidatus Thermoplasmatota archaeon]
MTDEQETYELVGVVTAVSEGKTAKNSPKFGLKVKPKDGDEVWINGFGSLPDGVEEGVVVAVEFTTTMSKDGQKVFRNFSGVTFPQEAESPQQEQTGGSPSLPSLLPPEYHALTAMVDLYKASPPGSAMEFSQFMDQVRAIAEFLKGGQKK